VWNFRKQKSIRIEVMKKEEEGKGLYNTKNFGRSDKAFNVKQS
jgi:hypothetical protein